MNRLKLYLLATAVTAAVRLLPAGADPSPAAAPASQQPVPATVAMAGPPSGSGALPSVQAAAAGRQSPGIEVSTYTDYIDSRAAIESPEVAAQPSVVPIDTSSPSPSGGPSTIGVAIVDNPAGAADDFAVRNRVDYAWLGVTAGDTPADELEPLDLGIESGALVHEVFQGSPADRAGIRPGDVITRVDGRRTYGSLDLAGTVAGLPPGAAVQFTLVRDGREMSLEVRLDGRPDDHGLSVPVARLWPGFAVAEDENGAILVGSVDHGGRAASEVQQGDVVRTIDGSPVGGLEGFYRLLNASGSRLLLGLKRDGESTTASVER